ncbi:DUF3054 domain-containing protein [Pseudonocardia sp. TRM90224]|uniref:DUF3054 domain-containing protein n=1 Tax=Pseudonocardia sp. TRM90224 TaxID=2812678 RepID=UPI001E44EF2C|nr:DUF3054 domain-containing protein [Pseudonocardia sp. TRM90224]
MPDRRVTRLALAADVVAVIVFAAVGRITHSAEADDLLGLVATIAPFAVGLGAAWATSAVRTLPAGFVAGAVVLAGTAGIGLLLRFAFTGTLPFTFAVVTVISLAVLMLGWRALSALVALRTRGPVRGARSRGDLH